MNPLMLAAFLLAPLLYTDPLGARVQLPFLSPALAGLAAKITGLQARKEWLLPPVSAGVSYLASACSALGFSVKE